MAYKGPGFYNELGERVCSLHSESMMEFIDDQDSTDVLKEELFGDNIKWGGTD